MSNRGRTRRTTRGAGRSYTDRLQRRTAYRPPRTVPTWLTAPRLPAALLLVAEAGHLAATVTEWQAAPPRGLFHALAAGLLGAIAITVYFGASRPGAALALTATVAIPACWLVGAIAGLSAYRHYPSPAAAAQSAVELAAAGLLAVRWRTNAGHAPVEHARAAR